MVYGLMAGLWSVPAFPVVGFAFLCVWVLSLPICQLHCSKNTIVMQLLKDNLGFC